MSAVLRPATRAAVWILIGVSVVGSLAALLYGERLAQPSPGVRDSYADVPLGSRAFVETLEALGLHVLRARRGRFAEVRSPLVFIEPEREAQVDGRRVTLEAALEERVEAGLPSVVVLPKWRWEDGEARPDRDARALLEAVLPGAALVHAGSPRAPMETSNATGDLGSYTISVPWLQTVDASDAETLLAQDGHALVVRRADGVLVVSDPDLVHNWNLQREEHAELAFDVLVEAGARDVVALDEVFHGHGERRSLGAALGRFPAVLLSAHGLALLLLVVWMGSRRFGPAHDLPPLGHGPGESIAVSAFVLSEGRPLGPLAERYVRAQLADIAGRLGLAPGRAPSEQAAHIDRVAAQRGEDIRAAPLLARAAARDEDALQLARDAHHLRTRLLARTKN